MRQIQIALGKESTRVERLYLANDITAIPDFVRNDYPNMLIMTVAASDRRQYFQAYTTPSAPYIGALFVVDPRGHLILHYPASVEPKGLYDDVKRLLHLSQIG